MEIILFLIVSYFKLIEFQIITFYGLYNSNNLFDSSLLLNLERAFWMLIENIIDNFDADRRKLVLVQIIFSSILGIPTGWVIIGLIVYAIYLLILKCLCGTGKIDEQSSEKNEENEENNVGVVEVFNLDQININTDQNRLSGSASYYTN